MYLWLMLFVSIALGAFGQIFMKVAMNRMGAVPPLQDGALVLGRYFVEAALTLPMIGAVACYGFSFLLWLAVLSKADLSLARPLMSLGYLVTLAYGFYAGEAVTTSRVFGTLLIIGGVMLLVRDAV